MIHQTEIESKDYDKVTANTRSFIVAKSDHEYNVGDFLGLNEIIICQNGEQRETGKFTLLSILTNDD